MRWEILEYQIAHIFVKEAILQHHGHYYVILQQMTRTQAKEIPHKQMPI